MTEKKPYLVDKNLTAEHLLRIVKHHKKVCKGCSICLMLLGELYGNLVGRELTSKEWDVFA